MVGDEPQSVETGAAVLAHGGNAVDAATASYFALSVTYPVAAGLGGGGVCIVRDPARSQPEAYVFFARTAGRGGAYAIPGNVSGFSLLQATYGRLPWQRVVSPAESSAAAGFLISQALAARLVASQDLIRLDAGLASEFLDESAMSDQPVRWSPRVALRRPCPLSERWEPVDSTAAPSRPASPRIPTPKGEGLPRPILLLINLGGAHRL